MANFSVPADAPIWFFEFIRELETELNGIKVPASYTVADLPDASSHVREVIWVSDETGGATRAQSDGTNWRRYSDGAVVS